MESNPLLTFGPFVLMAWTLAVFFLGKAYGRRARDREVAAHGSERDAGELDAAHLAESLDAIAAQVERIGAQQDLIMRQRSIPAERPRLRDTS